MTEGRQACKRRLLVQHCGTLSLHLTTLNHTPLYPGITGSDQQHHGCTRRLISPARTGTTPASAFSRQLRPSSIPSPVPATTPPRLTSSWPQTICPSCQALLNVATPCRSNVPTVPRISPLTFGARAFLARATSAQPSARLIHG